MRKFYRCVTMIGCAVALCTAGCSSSGSYQGQMDSLTRSPQPPVYAENGHQGLSSLLQDGDTEFSPLSAVLRRDLHEDSPGVKQAPQGTAFLQSVAGDGADGLLVAFNIDGSETPIHFPANSRSTDPRYPGISHYYYLQGDAGAFRYFWPWTGTDEDSRFDYLDLYGWSVGWPPAEYSGYSTIGLRTPIRNLPIGSAVYRGIMKAEMWDSDKPQWDTQASIEGISFLRADFDEGRITGNIGDLRVGPIFGDRSAHQALAAGNRIDISGTMHKDGRFTAEWVGSGPEPDAEFPLTMRGFAGAAVGDLYGPGGQEIGGVLSGKRGARDANPEQFLIGVIGASQADS